MAIVYDKIIEHNGTEVDFYKKIIEYLTTTLNAGITCDDDPDVEFNITTKGGSYKPSFTFKVGSNEFFKLYRNQSLDSTEWQVGCSIDFPAYDSIKNNEIYFKNTPKVDYDASTYRFIKISSLITSGIIDLRFRSCDNAPSTKSIEVIYASSNSYAYRAGQVNQQFLNNIQSLMFYDVDSNSRGVFMSRFGYTSPVGKIDFIKSSIYSSNPSENPQDNRVKVFEITGFYDCTNVVAGNTISLSDGNYLAVGTNQLVKIS